MSLWSAQQREWLQALGHPALALASTAPEAAPARLDAEPVRAPAHERAPGPRAGHERTPAARGDDAPDEAVLALYDAAALRGYPAAKRALWPLLRSLRRGPRP